MQTLLTAATPARLGRQRDGQHLGNRDQGGAAPEEQTGPSGDCQSYACERCGATCDSKAFTTCTCPVCFWRVLQKTATVREGRSYTTD